MNILEKTKNEKYLLLALLFIILNAIAIILLFGFQDTGEGGIIIRDDIHGLLGQAETSFFHCARRFSALGILIAAPFEFLGDGAGLILQNLFFYLFSAYLIFRIIELVFHNREQAFLGTLLYIASLPILQFGLGYSNDMGGWFFFILSIFLTLLYLKNRNEKLIILNGFLSGLGFSMKENGCLGILFFIMIILLIKEFNFREKFFKILKFGIPFLLPILILQTYMYITFRCTSWHWWRINQELHSTQTLRDQPGQIYSYLNSYASFLYNYAGEFSKSFGIIGLFLSIIGIWKECLHKNKERLKIYLALVPPSFVFLGSFACNSRLSFISTPLMVLLASYGLVYLKSIFSEKKGSLIIFILAMSHVVFNYYFYITFHSYRLLILKLINFILF